MKVIIKLQGSFGNQLFAYCFGYSLAKEKKAELIVDSTLQDNGQTRKLELLNLKVVYDGWISCRHERTVLGKLFLNDFRIRRAIGWKTALYQEKQATSYEPEVYEVKGDTYFLGYWQSEKYFRKYRDELLPLLSPAKHRSEEVQSLMSRVEKENSVAVHIRRGDYLLVHGAISMEYYDQAIAKMQKVAGEDLIFYIFSDDLEYCREYFKKFEDEIRLVYPQYESDNPTLDDLFLMSRCRHMIMANSTYSWWGGWLNQNLDKIVFCPEVTMWSGDFYPDEWRKIPAKLQEEGDLQLSEKR